MKNEILEELHLGKMVKEQVNSKGIRTAWLANQLHCHRNNIYKIYEKDWIDTHILLKLCYILDYDFFALLSQHYQEQRKNVCKRTQNGEETHTNQGLSK